MTVELLIGSFISCRLQLHRWLGNDDTWVGWLLFMSKTSRPHHLGLRCWPGSGESWTATSRYINGSLVYVRTFVSKGTSWSVLPLLLLLGVLSLSPHLPLHLRTTTLGERLNVSKSPFLVESLQTFIIHQFKSNLGHHLGGMALLLYASNTLILHVAPPSSFWSYNVALP